MSEEYRTIETKCDTGYYIEVVCGMLLAYMVTSLSTLVTSFQTKIRNFIIVNLLILGFTISAVVYLNATIKPTFFSNRNDDDCNFLWLNKLYWILFGTIIGHVASVIMFTSSFYIKDNSKGVSTVDDSSTSQFQPPAGQRYVPKGEYGARHLGDLHYKDRRPSKRGRSSRDISFSE